jgi:hypothetical protein
MLTAIEEQDPSAPTTFIASTRLAEIAAVPRNGAGCILNALNIWIPVANCYWKVI